MDETSSCDSISHYRFIAKCKANKEKLKDVLNASEMKNWEEVIIKLVQKESFNKNIPYYWTMRKWKNKRLQKLCPFLDENGIIRVGGMPIFHMKLHKFHKRFHLNGNIRLSYQPKPYHHTDNQKIPQWWASKTLEYSLKH